MHQFPVQIASVGDETVHRARHTGVQHAYMSPENDTRQFIWFPNVLPAFLSGSELLSTLFYY